MIPERNHPTNPIKIWVLQASSAVSTLAKYKRILWLLDKCWCLYRKHHILQISGKSQASSCQCRNSIRARLIAGKPVQKDLSFRRVKIIPLFRVHSNLKKKKFQYLIEIKTAPFLQVNALYVIQLLPLIRVQAEKLKWKKKKICLDLPCLFLM